MSPFVVQGISEKYLHFLVFCEFLKQTMWTLVRRRILRRLTGVCTVCVYLKNGVSGLKRVNRPETHSQKLVVAEVLCLFYGQIFLVPLPQLLY